MGRPPEAGELTIAVATDCCRRAVVRALSRHGSVEAILPALKRAEEGLPHRAESHREIADSLVARERSAHHWPVHGVRHGPERGSARPVDRSAPASREAAPGGPLVLALQRAAGNTAVNHLLVQRHAGADLSSHTVTAAEEKEMPSTADAPKLLAEKNELEAKQRTRQKAAKEAARNKQPPPALSDLDDVEKKRLAELVRLLGIRTKGDEAETLKANGIKGTAAQWFAKMQRTTFLGAPIVVHELLATRLAKAEKLIPQPWTDLVASTSTLRGPGESLHSFGLAIDINPGTNPHLVNPTDPHGPLYEKRAQSKAISDVIHRAILLVRAQTPKEAGFWKRTTGADKATRVGASYDLLEGASDAVEMYFKLDDPANKAQLDDLVAALAGKDKRTAADWKRWIKKDRKQIETGAGKGWQKRKTGFLDIRRDIVEALTSDAGAGLTWLGDNTIASGRDIMHFDLRGAGPIRKIVKSALGTTTPLGGD